LGSTASTSRIARFWVDGRVGHEVENLLAASCECINFLSVLLQHEIALESFDCITSELTQRGR
jgi:hypothetical protein